VSNINGAPTTRKQLPNRRRATTLAVEAHGSPFTASFGYFPDGKVGEIFLQNHRPGSQADSNARDGAIAASLALQYGCPLEVLRRALLRDSHGRPSTPLGAALDAISEGGQ
jgi:hypothetical protein